MEQTRQTPVFSREQLVSLIWPLLLEQFLSVSMGFADTFMVSGVGEAAVSSVSLVDSLNILIIQVLAALATGGAVIASQYLGHRDVESARRGSAQLYYVLGVSTLAVMILVMGFSRGNSAGCLRLHRRGCDGLCPGVSADQCPVLPLYGNL